MIVRFLGGPWDGQVKDIQGHSVKLAEIPSKTVKGYEVPDDSRIKEHVYHFHKLEGYERTFWLGVRPGDDLDDMLAHLLYG